MKTIKVLRTITIEDTVLLDSIKEKNGILFGYDAVNVKGYRSLDNGASWVLAGGVTKIYPSKNKVYKVYQCNVIVSGKRTRFQVNLGKE